MTVPEEQTYTEGSVAKGALPLIGRWLEDDAQVMFKPVAGVFPHSALCGRGGRGDRTGGAHLARAQHDG